MFDRLVIKPQAFYDLLVAPNFADLTPDGPYNGTLNEFTVMDDITSERPIIDILGNSNILKRRDATCNITFTPVATATPRKIKVDPIYGATVQCDNAFYQGCLRDFRSQNPKFKNYIMSMFLKAIKNDLMSNSYFGDISRASDANGVWNWNTFDGIFKKYAGYIADNTIPASQTFALAAGAIAPATAYSYLESAYDAQDALMMSLPPTMKAFYVSQGVFRGYYKYLQAIGGAYDIAFYKNGVPQLSYEGIPVLLEPTWTPILTALNGGTQANAMILTIRGNFVFATDNSYGEGEDLKRALMVWYSEDQLVWKYAMFMQAGTQIALPQHTVFAMTEI